MAIPTDSQDTIELLDEIAGGDSAALEQLLELHRPYLNRLVRMQIEPALNARIDVSDVVQEVQMVIANGIDEFIRQRPTSFRIWVRRKTLDELIAQTPSAHWRDEAQRPQRAERVQRFLVGHCQETDDEHTE